MTFPFCSVAIVVLFFGARVYAGSPNLIVNGNFDEPAVTVGGWRTFTAKEGMPGWKVVSGAVDITSTKYFASRSGRQSLDLNALEPGAISQRVATKAGEVYLLSFAFAANPIHDPGRKVMEVFWNDRRLGVLEFDSTGKTGRKVGWETLSCAVRGSGSDTVTFRSLSPGWSGPAIDKVSLTAAPVGSRSGLRFSF